MNSEYISRPHNMDQSCIPPGCSLGCVRESISALYCDFMILHELHSIVELLDAVRASMLNHKPFDLLHFSQRQGRLVFSLIGSIIAHLFFKRLYPTTRPFVSKAAPPPRSD